MDPFHDKRDDAEAHVTVKFGDSNGTSDTGSNRNKRVEREDSLRRWAHISKSFKFNIYSIIFLVST